MNKSSTSPYWHSSNIPQTQGNCISVFFHTYALYSPNCSHYSLNRAESCQGFLFYYLCCFHLFSFVSVWKWQTFNYNICYWIFNYIWEDDYNLLSGTKISLHWTTRYLIYPVTSTLLTKDKCTEIAVAKIVFITLVFWPIICILFSFLVDWLSYMLA